VNTALPLLQTITALGLLNVWLLRFNKNTAYRGGQATNLIEEFAVYGLPAWFCYLIGALKVSAAIALLLGFMYPQLIPPAAGLIAVLMVGAVAMHMKVKDPIKKAIPASLMLLMSGLILFNSI
jgi:uncharacterized membrane protein YphA (DoxX/SURF4 family)